MNALAIFVVAVVMGLIACSAVGEVSDGGDSRTAEGKPKPVGARSKDGRLVSRTFPDCGCRLEGM